MGMMVRWSLEESLCLLLVDAVSCGVELEACAVLETMNEIW